MSGHVDTQLPFRDLKNQDMIVQISLELREPELPSKQTHKKYVLPSWKSIAGNYSPLKKYKRTTHKK